MRQKKDPQIFGVCLERRARFLWIQFLEQFLAPFAGECLVKFGPHCVPPVFVFGSRDFFFGSGAVFFWIRNRCFWIPVARWSPRDRRGVVVPLLTGVCVSQMTQFCRAPNLLSCTLFCFALLLRKTKKIGFQALWDAARSEQCYHGQGLVFVACHHDDSLA